jgi:serine/threonine protein kinase
MKAIGRYRIGGLLGRGGMAKIYKVTLPVIEKTAALKLLAPDPLLARMLGMEKLSALFLAEARAMAALNHPNIVAIHDFDRHQGKPFYVMDFFPNNLGALIGETYRVEKPSRTIGADKSLDYIRQILDGLACLHDAGIVHRDIKPFNLLLTARDTIKICDFGLSKLRGETFVGPKNLNVGSPYYAAPEQEQNPDGASPPADLYAVGVTFYRMLTGRLPTAPPGRKAYVAPSRLNTELDAVWDRFIARALAYPPDKRFADAKSMLIGLDNLEGHWRASKALACEMPLASERRIPSRTATALRVTPIKAPPGQAAERFELDPLWRPAEYYQNDFEVRAKGIVADHATGLIWQQSGSAYPRSWQAAKTYVESLNVERFGGYQLWRLPTVDELITLLRPTPQGRDLCIAPLFDPTQRWIWSADRRSFMAAYYVDTALGFVGWQDFSAPYYVRAICSKTA